MRPFITTVSAATLALSVGYVVGVCAEKQMVWVDAKWIVAAVQDPQAVRYRAVKS